LLEYTQDGEFVLQHGSNGWKDEETQFSEPVGIAVAPNGDIYIADYWNRVIRVFSSDFEQKSEISVPSWGSEAVTDRGYLALLPDGRLLATDPANGRILAFGPDGAEIGPYEMPKEGSNPTARPVGITTDGTSVWVAEAAGGVVRKIPLAEILP
jgi:streptogramin lyase